MPDKCKQSNYRYSQMGAVCVCKLDHDDPVNWEVDTFTFFNCPAEGDPDEEEEVIRCKTCGCLIVVGETAVKNALLQAIFRRQKE